MDNTAVGAPSFNLRKPTQYFTDGKSIALLTAALSGDTARAKFLVAEGADPNDEGPKDNNYNRIRLLHYAIAAGSPQAIRVLMEAGADPELKTEGSGRALMFAMTLDKPEMLAALLDLRPVQNLRNETLRSILFGTVAMPRPRCLELLLQRGAPIDLPNGAGYTIMMDAMDAQDYELAEALLVKGASVHIEAGGGMTPAYLVEFHLKKFKPGSPTYNKVLHLKKLMEEKGAVFPALSPAEVRAKRAKQ